MNSYKPLSYCYFVVFCLAILYDVVQGPYKDGDIILGGLLRVHLRGNSENQCGKLDVRGLNRVFAMIFAIERFKITSKCNSRLRYTRLLWNCTASYPNLL